MERVEDSGDGNKLATRLRQICINDGERERLEMEQEQ